MLGEPIERIEDQGTTCLYYGPAGLSGKLAQEGTADLLKQIQKPGAQVNGNDVTDTLSKLVGGLAAQAGAGETGGAGGSSGDVPLLTFVIDGEDGKPQMTALTATKAIFGGIGKAASDGKEGFGADIPGLGDRAVRLANLGLNVLQGNTLIRLGPGSRSRRERESNCYRAHYFAEALEFAGTPAAILKIAGVLYRLCPAPAGASGSSQLLAEHAVPPDHRAGYHHARGRESEDSPNQLGSLVAESGAAARNPYAVNAAEM